MSHAAIHKDANHTRADIVDAAAEIYRHFDWDAVTMTAVARRARLSRALVYVYFRDRDGLHLAITLRALETLHLRFRQAAECETRGIDKLSAIWRAYIEFARELPHFFDACARVESRCRTPPAPDTRHEPLRNAMDRLFAVLMQALSDGQRDGSVRRDIGELPIICQVLWGFNHGVLQGAIHKAHVLNASRITASALLEQAGALMVHALATPRNE